MEIVRFFLSSCFLGTSCVLLSSCFRFLLIKAFDKSPCSVYLAFCCALAFWGE
jgi:hypothetical protein